MCAASPSHRVRAKQTISAEATSACACTQTSSVIAAQGRPSTAQPCTAYTGLGAWPTTAASVTLPLQPTHRSPPQRRATSSMHEHRATAHKSWVVDRQAGRLAGGKPAHHSQQHSRGQRRPGRLPTRTAARTASRGQRRPGRLPAWTAAQASSPLGGGSRHRSSPTHGGTQPVQPVSAGCGYRRGRLPRPKRSVGECALSHRQTKPCIRSAA
jgi:hypothetical protein